MTVKTIKKADCQRIDAFKLWYWRRLLRVPWTVLHSHMYRETTSSWISPQISKPLSLDGDRESLASSFPGDYYAGKDLTDVSNWSAGEDS